MRLRLLEAGWIRTCCQWEWTMSRMCIGATSWAPSLQGPSFKSWMMPWPELQVLRSTSSLMSCLSRWELRSGSLQRMMNQRQDSYWCTPCFKAIAPTISLAKLISRDCWSLLYWIVWRVSLLRWRPRHSIKWSKPIQERRRSLRYSRLSKALSRFLSKWQPVIFSQLQRTSKESSKCI